MEDQIEDFKDVLHSASNLNQQEMRRLMEDQTEVFKDFF